ncbi:hypothetical protein [Salsuginibacillus kocurii]|uniref:hypothetical protein n=1 Tax=Salsuginibacillus kocurii TaxID=427078 RepID=UPI000369F9B3|nr:hypothetical protein [Salsuginibacillus kocurii]
MFLELENIWGTLGFFLLLIAIIFVGRTSRGRSTQRKFLLERLEAEDPAYKALLPKVELLKREFQLRQSMDTYFMILLVAGLLSFSRYFWPPIEAETWLALVNLLPLLFFTVFIIVGARYLMMKRQLGLLLKEKYQLELNETKAPNKTKEKSRKELDNLSPFKEHRILQTMQAFRERAGKKENFTSDEAIHYER